MSEMIKVWRPIKNFMENESELYITIVREKSLPTRASETVLRIWMIFFVFWEYMHDGIVVVGRPAVSDTVAYRNSQIM